MTKPCTAILLLLITLKGRRCWVRVRAVDLDAHRLLGLRYAAHVEQGRGGDAEENIYMKSPALAEMI